MEANTQLTIKKILKLYEEDPKIGADCYTIFYITTLADEDMKSQVFSELMSRMRMNEVPRNKVWKFFDGKIQLVPSESRLERFIKFHPEFQRYLGSFEELQSFPDNTRLLNSIVEEMRVDRAIQSNLVGDDDAVLREMARYATFLETNLAQFLNYRWVNKENFAWCIDLFQAMQTHKSNQIIRVQPALLSELITRIRSETVEEKIRFTIYYLFGEGVAKNIQPMPFLKRLETLGLGKDSPLHNQLSKFHSKTASDGSLLENMLPELLEDFRKFGLLSDYAMQQIVRMSFGNKTAEQFENLLNKRRDVVELTRPFLERIESARQAYRQYHHTLIDSFPWEMLEKVKEFNGGILPDDYLLDLTHNIRRTYNVPVEEIPKLVGWILGPEAACRVPVRLVNFLRRFGDPVQLQLGQISRTEFLYNLSCCYDIGRCNQELLLQAALNTGLDGIPSRLAIQQLRIDLCNSKLPNGSRFSEDKIVAVILRLFSPVAIRNLPQTKPSTRSKHSSPTMLRGVIPTRLRPNHLEENLFLNALKDFANKYKEWITHDLIVHLYNVYKNQGKQDVPIHQGQLSLGTRESFDVIEVPNAIKKQMLQHETLSFLGPSFSAHSTIASLMNQLGSTEEFKRRYRVELDEIARAIAGGNAKDIRNAVYNLFVLLRKEPVILKKETPEDEMDRRETNLIRILHDLFGPIILNKIPKNLQKIFCGENLQEFTREFETLEAIRATGYDIAQYLLQLADKMRRRGNSVITIKSVVSKFLGKEEADKICDFFTGFLQNETKQTIDYAYKVHEFCLKYNISFKLLFPFAALNKLTNHIDFMSLVNELNRQMFGIKLNDIQTIISDLFDANIVNEIMRLLAEMKGGVRVRQTELYDNPPSLDFMGKLNQLSLEYDDLRNQCEWLESLRECGRLTEEDLFDLLQRMAKCSNLENAKKIIFFLFGDEYACRKALQKEVPSSCASIESLEYLQEYSKRFDFLVWKLILKYGGEAAQLCDKLLWLRNVRDPDGTVPQDYINDIKEKLESLKILPPAPMNFHPFSIDTKEFISLLFGEETARKLDRKTCVILEKSFNGLNPGETMDHITTRY